MGISELNITISNGRIEEYLCIFCALEISPFLKQLGYPKIYRGFKKNTKTGAWYEFCDRCGSHSLGAGEEKYYESRHQLSHVEFGIVNENKIELLFKKET